MEYGAIDLHKKESQIRIVTESGDTFDRRIATTRDRFTSVFEWEAADADSTDSRHWTINGCPIPRTSPIVVRANRRYRWILDNQSADGHLIHLQYCEVSSSATAFTTATRTSFIRRGAIPVAVFPHQ
jgi:FtsP/CotA-like multicopper oxidase with cupredoxin domain